MNTLLKVCLGIAVATVLAVYMFKLPLNSILVYAGILICPLMHIFMMRHDGHSHPDKNKTSH